MILLEKLINWCFQKLLYPNFSLLCSFSMINEWISNYHPFDQVGLCFELTKLFQSTFMQMFFFSTPRSYKVLHGVKVWFNYIFTNSLAFLKPIYYSLHFFLELCEWYSNTKLSLRHPNILWFLYGSHWCQYN